MPTRLFWVMLPIMDLRQTIDTVKRVVMLLALVKVTLKGGFKCVFIA